VPGSEDERKPRPAVDQALHEFRQWDALTIWEVIEAAHHICDKYRIDAQESEQNPHG